MSSNLTLISSTGNTITGATNVVFIGVHNFSGTPINNNTFIGSKLSLNLGAGGIASGGTNTLTVDNQGNVFYSPGIGIGSGSTPTATTIISDFKSGAITPTSFSGNPKKANILFTSAYTNTSYIVELTGSDSRSFIVESKTASGFTINTNSNFILSDNVYYFNTLTGETDSVSANLAYGAFGTNINTIGTTLATGSAGFINIPYTCIIQSWYLVANTSGSVVIDIKRGGTSLVGGGNKPTLTAAQRNNALQSGWSTINIFTNDEIEFVVNSSSGIQNVNLTINVIKI